MKTLNECIDEYKTQLNKGMIQKDYQGIMKFMSGLNGDMKNKYPDYTIGALYHGLMDMTYFSFTPIDLKKNDLKIAIVYSH